MAKQNEERIVLAELQDLSPEMKEITIGKEGCFYKYRNSKEIGEKIYVDVMKKYTRDGKVFNFSDEFNESGLLSQMQGLATVLSLFEGFKLDAKDKKITKFIDNMLDDLFDRVIGKDGAYHIDASPYLVENKTVFAEYQYMDSVTWIISTLLGVFRMYIKGHYAIDFDSERGRTLLNLYRYCLRYINDAFIDNSRAKARFNCGWNFTRDCEEPSLYFTFAVSELLIDILNSFENVIRVADVELIQNGIRREIDQKGFLKEERYLSQSDRIKAALDAAKLDDSFEGYGEALKEFYEFTDEEKTVIYEVQQKIDFVMKEYEENLRKKELNDEEYRRELEVFRLINGGFDVYETGSLYKTLEDNCKKSANQIWKMTEKKLANSFFSYNLESEISEEIINNSVSSDAIFNVIFIINILINSGLDEDYEDLINYFTVNGSEAYHEAMDEYDDMRDTIRLAYDNCYQSLTRLKKANKDYKVNEYELSFDETFVKHADRVRDVRKAHIRVFSLMPLMVRTKTTIVEFLIRYPQYDMMLYLENILKYRCMDEQTGQYIWLWENEGYSASSNYYFISAFGDFYEYYNEYESVFHDTVENNKEAKKNIEEKYHKSLREAGLAVDRSEEEYAALLKAVDHQKQQIRELEEQVQYYENDPLRSALNEIVNEIIQKHIVDIMAKKLSEEAARIIAGTKDRVLNAAERYQDESGADSMRIQDWKDVKSSAGAFEKGLRDAILATMLAEQLGQTMYSTRLTTEAREDGLNNIERYMRNADKDLKMATRYYLQGVTDGKNSTFVANEGRSTLPTNLHGKLIDLLEQKDRKGDKS